MLEVKNAVEVVIRIFVKCNGMCKQAIILHCDWLIAPLDKNSSQFSQSMVLAGSDT